MTLPIADKIIVSNLGVLAKKYGASGTAKVSAAVKRLIAADLKRGLVTVLVDLSDAAVMKACGAKAVPAGSETDPEINKKAIDAVYLHGDVRPSYLMVLGSRDVIPHVPLNNPLSGDGDADVPSDLPYACDKTYGVDVQDFLAPTRVIGRLPNVTGDTVPDYLVSLIDTAATYSSRPATDYSPFLGISASVWKKSTEMSMDAIFGTHSGLKISPPDGYKWTAAESKRLAHFVNCHGSPGDPNFYGQKGGAYPVAHSAKWMASKIASGTVMAAECCYGVELYDPKVTPTAQGQMGMCNTYLGSGAYAFLGSTNIAYGPTATNDQADLICQLFSTNLAAGASTGRASLQSRLDYVAAKGGLLLPADLKTLGQFTLMADPSLTPVTAQPHTIAISLAKATPKSGMAASIAIARHARQDRRVSLVTRAEATVSRRLEEPTDSLAVRKSGVFAKLRQLARDHGIDAPDTFITYSLGRESVASGAKSLRFAASPAVGPGPKAVHAIIQRMDPPKDIPQLILVRGVQAIEYDDVMDARAFESR